jgi:hypothetical protein
MESVHCRAIGERLSRIGQVAEARAHFIGRAGDHRRIQPRDAGGELRAQRARDFVVRSLRMIVVDSGVAVDLKIDEGGREVGSGAGGGRDGLDRILKREFDGGAGKDISAATAWRNMFYSQVCHMRMACKWLESSAQKRCGNRQLPSGVMGGDGLQK